jgi:hypothetical protein
MMEEFDSAGQWMLGQLASKRSTPRATSASSASEAHRSVGQADGSVQLDGVCVTRHEGVHGAPIAKN